MPETGPCGTPSCDHSQRHSKLAALDVHLPPDPDELDATIRAEADRLLGSGLRDVLSEFGEVSIIGSYSLHLMAWRDLDIEIVRADSSRRAFFDLGYRVAECLSPTRMQYRDETVAQTPGLPMGWYWGVYLGDERKGAWKIDIWSVDRRQADAREASDRRLQAALTPDARRAIVVIKSQVWADPGYRRTFSSQDIYDAVLGGGIRDLAGFRDFLRGRT